MEQDQILLLLTKLFEAQGSQNSRLSSVELDMAELKREYDSVLKEILIAKEAALVAKGVTLASEQAASKFRYRLLALFSIVSTLTTVLQFIVPYLHLGH